MITTPETIASDCETRLDDEVVSSRGKPSSPKSFRWDALGLMKVFIITAMYRQPHRRIPVQDKESPHRNFRPGFPISIGKEP